MGGVIDEDFLKEVKVIVVNHGTSGLFASFQWVMLAMRFAKAAGLRAYVDHGPCTLCGYAPFTQVCTSNLSTSYFRFISFFQ